MIRPSFRFPLIALVIMGCALPALSLRAKASNPQTSKTQASNPQAKTNLALNKRVSASSSDELGSWGARFLVDGLRDEKPGARGWEGSSDPKRNHTEWVQIDLGVSATIGSVDIYPRNDPARVGEGFPVDFTIETSKDGQTWTVVVRKTNYGKPGNAVQHFAFNPVGARYVRVVGTNLRYLGAEQAYYMQFAEIEVYAGSQESSGSTSSSGSVGLTGMSLEGEIRLNEGSTRSLTAVIDGANQISDKVISQATRTNAASLALQETYDPGTFAGHFLASGISPSGVRRWGDDVHQSLSTGKT